MNAPAKPPRIMTRHVQKSLFETAAQSAAADAAKTALENDGWTLTHTGAGCLTYTKETEQ